MNETDKRLHRCCFTGHRPEKLHESELEIKQKLEEMIDQAVADGFVTFITGMAMGVDLWAAEIVLQKKAKNPTLHLIAATPYASFSARWHNEWRNKYNTIWNAADYRVIVSKGYSNDVFQRRNEWMVNHVSRVIAYYNGEKGGTRNTINYANSKGVDVIVVDENAGNLNDL